MAVELVGDVGAFASVIPRATGSFQISSPGSAVSAGDVVFVLVVYDYSGGDPDSITIPGFSRLGNVAVPSLTNGFSPYAQLLVKESSGSEPASYTVSKWTTGGGNNTDFAALSWALTGVDAADLVAGSSPVWVGTAQSTSQTLPSVTPDEAPGMVIWLLANQRYSDPPTTTVSTPAGTTEIGFATSTFAFAKAVYQLYTTTDPTGTKTATIGPTGPGSPGAALGVAIREATSTGVEGTAAAQLGGLAATATGERTHHGSGAGLLGGLSAAATGRRETAGDGLASLGGLSATAIGQVSRPTGAADLGGLVATATGVRATTGTAAADLGGLTATATGSIPGVLGVGSANLGGLAASGSGEVLDVPGVPFLTEYLGDSGRLVVEIAWGADLTDIAGSGWTWTDVTADVRQDPGINIKLGRDDEASTSQPASCTMTLDNRSGAYNLGGDGPNWPYVRRNTPVRVRVDPGDGLTYVLFQGYADGFTPGWDSLRGDLPIVSLSASGVLRRLEQGNAPVQSAYRRAMTNTDSVVAYWPMEEGKNATLATEARGGPQMWVLGSPDWATDEQFACSAALPQMKDAYMASGVVAYPDTGQNQVRWLMAVPDNGLPDGVVIAHIHTTGSVARFDIAYEAGDTGWLGIYIYDRSGQRIYEIPQIAFRTNGHPLRVSVEFQQVGADVQWSLSTVDAVPGAVALFVDGTLAGHTCGVVSHIELTPHGDGAELVLGHVTVQNAITSPFEATDPLVAHEGETGTAIGDRLDRLTRENQIHYTVFGSGEPLDTYDELGPQRVRAVVDLLREVEAADQGQLWDGKSAGVTYSTRRFRELTDVAMTVDAAAGELHEAFLPVQDDQRNRNRVQATIVDGATAVYEDVDGPMGTATIGFYDDTIEVNNRHDVMAIQYAAWRVALGTVEGLRYPTVTVSARTAPHLMPAAARMFPGHKIELVNVDQVLDGFPPGEPIRLIVEGVSHSINASDGWVATFQCSPHDPWAIGRLAATSGDTSADVIRLDTSGSVTTTTQAAGSTTLPVTTTTGPIWTTDPDDYPLTLDVGGIPVVATACSGTGAAQTFTVEPLTHDRPAGVPVRLRKPRPLGL